MPPKPTTSLFGPFDDSIKPTPFLLGRYLNMEDKVSASATAASKPTNKANTSSVRTAVSYPDSDSSLTSIGSLSPIPSLYSHSPPSTPKTGPATSGEGATKTSVTTPVKGATKTSVTTPVKGATKATLTTPVKGATTTSVTTPGKGAIKKAGSEAKSGASPMTKKAGVVKKAATPKKQAATPKKQPAAGKAATKKSSVKVPTRAVAKMGLSKKKTGAVEDEDEDEDQDMNGE